MKILGIESSCDETGVAIYDTDRGLLAHRLYSQVELHARYGGVVPELASRDHVRKLLPLTRQLLAESSLNISDLDGVAYTAGPGLVGALLVGACTGRAFAFALGVPSIGIHHMEGHLLAPLLEPDPPAFPFLALLVSGGHSMLVRVGGVGDYQLLGETLDDAAGEAFDKTAKLLGLPYPGGPELARLAENGDPSAFQLPRPMTDRPGLDLSFSGLKTAVLNAWQGSDQSPSSKVDLAASFQAAVVDTLRIKCQRALQQTGLPALVVSGGVGANRALRAALRTLGEKMRVKVAYPRLEFCTDNGAMIAFAGALRLQAGQQDQDLAVRVRARWPINELEPTG